MPASVSAEEKIHSFETQMTVNADTSVHIIETIRYDFDATSHHGIYRDIPKKFTDTNGVEHVLGISFRSVEDGSGVAYPWKDESDSTQYHIRIGDPTLTTTGLHTYVITYDAEDAVAFLKDRDELYWNVTGNGWRVPIDSVFTTVTLPKGFSEKELHLFCYRGSLGETTKCRATEAIPLDRSQDVASSSVELFQRVTFADAKLSLGQGLTIAVGFPKGIVVENLSFIKKVYKWIQLHRIEIDQTLAFAFPIGIGLYLFRYWYVKGRDPKGRGVIVAQYEPPPGLSLLESVLIVRTRFVSTDVSAAIISLAVKGALRIEKDTMPLLLVFSKDDYRLIATKVTVSLSGSEQSLLDGLFSAAAGAEGGILSMSKVNAVYMQALIKDVETAAGQELVEKHYFTRNPQEMQLSLVLPLIGSIVVVVAFAYFIAPLVWVWFGIFFSMLITFAFYRLMPQKTPEGALVKDALEGLKLYISVAEKDRIEFHNAPAKTPELFEKLLPYAMLFGLTDIWVKEFADIMKQPPQWYSGSGTAFVLSSFVGDLNGFSNSFASSSTPSSSGSGGGGFSGGGGGGGGGGSW